MDVIGVIPARYHSSRFPGKVLQKIGGNPMVQLVYEKAREATSLDDLLVATDDQRIREAVEGFGGKVVLTKKEHETGTDRLSEAVKDIEVKVVANIQADEPLVHPSMIDDMIRPLLDEPDLNMTTLAKRIENENELTNPNVVKVVMDKDGFALYFSRALIPCYGQRSGSIALQSGFKKAKPSYFKHIGMYGYTKDFLLLFANLPKSNLEDIERLEQLRVLENGYRIKVIETEYDTIGVDTPEDLEKIRELLERNSGRGVC